MVKSVEGLKKLIEDRHPKAQIIIELPLKFYDASSYYDFIFMLVKV